MIGDENLATPILTLDAYAALDSETREIVDEMLGILHEVNCDVDEKRTALQVINEALFPEQFGGPALTIEEMNRIDVQSSDEDARVLDAFEREQQRFANRLQSLMTQNGLTVDVVAERVGLSPLTVQLMLAGQCWPQATTVRALSRLFGVGPNEIQLTIPSAIEADRSAFVIELPKEIVGRFQFEAKSRGLSVSEYATTILRDAFAESSEEHDSRGASQQSQ